MTDLRERRRRGEEAEGTEIQRETLSLSLSLSCTHVGVEKSASWRTLAPLTPLNIEQRDGKGGEGTKAQQDIQVTEGMRENGAQGPLGLDRNFSKQNMKDKHLKEVFKV